MKLFHITRNTLHILDSKTKGLMRFMRPVRRYMPPKTKWMLTIILFDFLLLSLLLLTLSHRNFNFYSLIAQTTQANPSKFLPSNTENKKIALTFDDGPHPYYTEQLLDGLKDRGVIVTFFVTGAHSELHPDVISRMKAEGHMIGNHTFTHLQLTKHNRNQFKQELIDTNEVIAAITGESPSYVRPPYGSWDKSLEIELNMIPVLWTVDPLDWCSDDVVCITSNVINKVEENDIILMHDYYETSVTAALEIVDQLLEEDYVFVTVEEILFE